jgi:excisionase family DNA binding protein
MSRLMSILRVAELTETSQAFWRKALMDGRIRGVKLGRLIRLREEDIELVLRKGIPSRRSRVSSGEDDESA